MTRTLVVTAVEVERASVLDGLGAIGLSIEVTAPSGRDHGVDVIVAGVGSAAAAANTAVTLATAAANGSPYHRVVCLGIGGGVIAGRAAIGEIVVGTASVAADLGAQSADGFLPISDLGFGRNLIDADKALVSDLIDGLADARLGSILTVTTVTGSAARADELAGRHPDAMAEAMEGYGVACAADTMKTPFVEVRTISNPVGPRDRDRWRIPDALAAVTQVASVIGAAFDGR